MAKESLDLEKFAQGGIACEGLKNVIHSMLKLTAFPSFLDGMTSSKYKKL